MLVEKISTPDDIAELLLKYASELGYQTEVDKNICDEILEHWDRDINRIHIRHEHSDGISIFKVAGYLAFWIRKLKPFTFYSSFEDNISNQYLNELVSIYCLARLIHVELELRLDAETDTQIIKDIKKSQKKLIKIINHELDLYSSSSSRLGSNMYSWIYDMRFRTFGPHHMSHIARYLYDLSGADTALVHGKSKFITTDSYNRVVHIRFFISAPRDIQENFIKNGKLAGIIEKNYQKWIELHNIAVTTITMDSISSQAKGGKETVQEILCDGFENNFDVYFGMVDTCLGTPLEVNGVKYESGTEYELIWALEKQKTASKLVSFGKGHTLKWLSPSDLQKHGLNNRDDSRVTAFFNTIGSRINYWNWNESGFNENDLAEKFTREIEKKLILIKDEIKDH